MIDVINLWNVKKRCQCPFMRDSSIDYKNILDYQ